MNETKELEQADLIPIRTASEITGLTFRQLRLATERGELSRGWFSNRLVFLRPEVEKLARSLEKG